MAQSSESFQALMVELTRAFGWHRPTETPCGQPVPISEAHALLELSKAQSLTQKQLGAALKLRKSSVSRLVSNLQQRGWIERSRNPQDGRALDVRLTPGGVGAARNLAFARQRKMEGILTKIPAGERSMVMRSLETLIGAIHENDS